MYLKQRLLNNFKNLASNRNSSIYNMSRAKLECILSLDLHYNTKYLMKIKYYFFNLIIIFWRPELILCSLFIRIVNQTMYELES